MARRASRSFNPAWVGAAVLLVAAAIGGGFFFFGQKGDLTNHGLEEISPADYLENANSLRGNVYKVEGTIRNALAWSQERGRLISIEVEQNGSVKYLPVLLPASLNKVNVRQGQRVQMRVKVEANGLLIAESFDKA